MSKTARTFDTKFETKKPAFWRDNARSLKRCYRRNLG